MIETIIIGKRSNLSQVLIKNIDNAKVFSLKQILQKKKINIIYNHSYPLFNNYQKLCNYFFFDQLD